jgi:threonine synthase
LKGIFKYKKLLEGLENLEPISLGEGNTPLVRSKNIGPFLGLKNLFFKLESLNPTGSYKDRFGAFAISGLAANNSKLCLGTSSGNTGASLAAYSALAGIPCHLAIVDGAPLGKLRQMQSYGANLWMVKYFGIRESKTGMVFKSLHKLAKSNNTIVQVSAFAYSPFGMQGVQTISYELAEELPTIEHVFVPAGGGGLTLAVVRGFEKWSKYKKDFKIPQVHCVQPEGNDTMASAIRNKTIGATAIGSSSTVISGLQVPNIIDGDQVVVACQKNGGNAFIVKDQTIFDWHKRLAQTEGIYCEPAGAVAMAGLSEAIKAGEIDNNRKVVCLITGHGFKDPNSTEMMISGNHVKYIDQPQEINFNVR